MKKEIYVSFAGDHRWLTKLLMAAFLLIALAHAGTAKANDMHLIVNGKAIHFNERPDVHYNENNWGAGFQYDFGNKNDDVVPFITASGFKDSNGNPSFYAGGGAMRRYYFNVGDTRLHGDVGGIVFLMTRKAFRDGDPFFGVLPAFSIGGDKIAVNMTFIPKVEPKAVPLLFFQLKISLDLFRSGR